MKFAFAAIVAATLLPTAALAQVADGSFEGQGAASTGPGGYCYFLGNYAGACAGGSWTGGGTTSGLQEEGNQPWPGTPSPAGSYYAFIQSGYGAPGSISQTLTLAGGQYKLGWLDAGRRGYAGNQAYDVLLNGTAIAGGATTIGQAFTARSTGVLTLGAGAYTLTFQARDSGGDNAAFIDQVALAAVPEPATWGMMILGFGAMGVAIRRRAKVRATVSCA